MQFGIESLSAYDPAQVGFRNYQQHSCVRGECAERAELEGPKPKPKPKPKAVTPKLKRGRPRKATA
jgi:hypothetical protein